MAMKNLDDRGQTTVGLVAIIPAAIAVAAIAINALLFFSECAKFDRVASNAIRVCAASPNYGQGVDQSVTSIDELIEAEMGANTRCEVAAHRTAGGYTTFTATLFYDPNLFGAKLRKELFGIELGSLTHQISLTIDTYKPGILLQEPL